MISASSIRRDIALTGLLFPRGTVAVLKLVLVRVGFVFQSLSVAGPRTMAALRWGIFSARVMLYLVVGSNLLGHWFIFRIQVAVSLKKRVHGVEFEP